jgi:hypothetical protein
VFWGQILKRFFIELTIKHLRIFLLRNDPTGNHQLVAEDLTEDGNISRISNACSLRQGRSLPPTPEVEELKFVVLIATVKKEIKPPHHKLPEANPSTS